MPRYEGTTVSDASCDFVRLFQAAFEKFLTRAGYIFWLGRPRGCGWIQIDFTKICWIIAIVVQLSGGDTPSLGMTGASTGSHLDWIIKYSMIQVLENSTRTHFLHTWFQWIAGFISFLTIEHQVAAAKHSFFFPGEFCTKITPTLPGCTRKTSCCLGGRTCRRGGPGAFALWFRAKMCDVETRFSGDDIFCEFVLVPIEADLFVIVLNAEFCHLWMPLAPVNLLPAFPHRLATFPSYHEPHRAHRRPCAVQRTGHGPWFLSCPRVIFDVFLSTWLLG